VAVRFDASTEQYTATNGLPGNTYTLTAWVWPNAVGGRYQMLYWLTAAGDVFTGIGIRDSPTELQLIDGGSYTFNGVGPLTVSAQTWYRVAAVVSGATVTFYRSAAGAALGSASVGDFTTPASPTTWHLGDDPYDDWLDGRVAALKVWNAALTAAEVEAELAQYMPRRTANLIRWHPFLRAETVDYSGSGNALSGGTGTTTEDGPPIPWAAASPIVVRPASTQTTSGTLVGILPSLSAATSGTVTADGTLAAALPPLSAAATGEVSVGGTIDLTLPPLTGSVEGEIPSAGGLDVHLPAIAATTTGTVSVEGVANTTLPALSANPAGTVTASGSFDSVLPAITATFDATGTATAALAATLSPLIGDVTGSLAARADLAAVLPAFTAEAAGVVDTGDAILSVVLPPITGAVDGNVSFDGQIDAVLPALVTTASGEVEAFTAVLDAHLLPLTGTFDGAAAITGTATAVLPDLGAGLTSVAQVAGTAAAQLPTLAGAFQGLALYPQAQLVGALPSLQAVFAGVSQATELDIDGQVSAPAVGWPIQKPAASEQVGAPFTRWPVKKPTL
jgi:hypothetical protein